MPFDVPLRCRCGEVRGVVLHVAPGAGNRLVCHCDDCQTWMHHLGRADELLDEHGGTDIYQLCPDQVRIDAGQERLRCARLREGGLLRWYAACCDTPIANCMATMQLPFAGVVHACMDHASAGVSRDEALGPVIAHVFARFAVGDRAALEARANVYDRGPLWLVARVVRQLVAGRIRGRHRPTPFFDEATGRPISAPRVLEAAELQAAQEAQRSRR